MISNTNEQLRNLYAWIKFIANGEEVNLSNEDISLHVFGEGDASYLVINKYASDTEATQYVFGAKAENDKLLSLFDFLKTVDFDVKNLITQLEDAEYEQTDIGEQTTLGRIVVTRSYEKSN